MTKWLVSAGKKIQTFIRVMSFRRVSFNQANIFFCRFCASERMATSNLSLGDFQAHRPDLFTRINTFFASQYRLNALVNHYTHEVGVHWPADTLRAIRRLDFLDFWENYLAVLPPASSSVAHLIDAIREAGGGQELADDIDQAVWDMTMDFGKEEPTGYVMSVIEDLFKPIDENAGVGKRFEAICPNHLSAPSC
jgi:hypothetical protein